ncbi:hypothetical protein QC763_0068300 [Podospora pseudopauciseta]|uniref:Uncharacterized protein n=1 Tax=Podospora pseudopauciseta TaxID=2093780 RepID=A0ABR0HD64_9PEZI|nr:hypothetical protein QC763_0068300 [Podospora pseudopauciseta]
MFHLEPFNIGPGQEQPSHHDIHLNRDLSLISIPQKAHISNMDIQTSSICLASSKHSSSPFGLRYLDSGPKSLGGSQISPRYGEPVEYTIRRISVIESSLMA